MNRSAMALELRRGVGGTLLAVVAGTGVTFAAKATMSAGTQTDWSSNGPGVLAWLTTMTLLSGPVTAAAGAWVGSRDRRLGMTEMLAVTSRPRWHRDLASGAAAALALTAGLVLVAAAVVSTAAASWSYGGGRWPASAALLILSMLACSAIGFAAGRLISSRWTAPVTGAVVYLTGALPTYLDSAAGQLAPLANLPGGTGWRLDAGVGVLAAGWLLCLTATFFLLGSSRRRAFAALPALLGLAVAVPLAGLPVRWTGAGYTAAWTERDPAAASLVCTTDAPRVCVRRAHAGLLDAVTLVAREFLARFPAGVTATEEDLLPPGTRLVRSASVLPIPSLEGRAAPFTARLLDEAGLRREMREFVVSLWCSDRTPEMLWSQRIAEALLSPGAPVPAGPRSAESRTAWLGWFLAAAGSCEPAAFQALERSWPAA